MEGNILNVLEIMVVGMATVFLILWLVVIIGNLIIRLTNKYISSPEAEKPTKGIQAGNKKTKIAAIVAAVDIATGGNGQITEIKKV